MVFFFAFLTTLMYISNFINLKIVDLDFRDLIILGICNFFILSLSLAFFEPLGVPITLIAIVLYLNIINKEYIKNIILAVMTVMVIFVSDIIVGIMMLSIFKISKEQLSNSVNVYIILHIAVLVVNFIISKIMGCIILKKQMLKIHFQFVKFFLANLFVGLIMLYTIGNIYKFSGKDRYILILNLILLIIQFSLVAYIAKIYIKIANDEMRYAYKDEELKQLKEYMEMIENTNEDMRRFKHDYLNILSTINGYTDNRDIDGLKEYLNNYLIPMNVDLNNKNGSLNNLSNIKIMPIKGLISYKIRQAQKANINVIVDILEEIENININIVDLSRILGILLDNAIEEAVNCNNKKIIICMIKNKGSIVVAIANTCRENIPPIYKMLEEGFSTKNENRGLGLNTVQQLIYQEYSNISLNTYIENNVFKQELIIEY